MRNLLHYFIGFSLGYIVGSCADFDAFVGAGQYAGVFAGGFIGLVVGAFWEWGQAVVLKTKPDKNDILRTAVGGLFGAFISLFYPDVKVLVYLLSISSVLFVLIDLIFVAKVFKK